MNTRIIAGVLAALLLAGCSNGSDASSTVVTVVDTEADTTAATTDPPPTPTDAEEIGATISRSTALAANRCFDLWGSAQLAGRDGVAYLDDLDDLSDACDEAKAELEIDQIGVPPGDSPVNTLAAVLATVAVVVSFAKLELLSEGDCSGVTCILADEDTATFLTLDDMGGAGLPDAFQGDQSLRTATIEDIEGLVVD